MCPRCGEKTEAEACFPCWLEVPQRLRVNLQMLRARHPTEELRAMLLDSMRSEGRWPS